MPSTAATIHVLDFEGSRHSGVVEYGVVTLVGGQVQAVHTRLCAAAGSLDPAEAAVHGLRDSDLAGAAPFSADLARFASLRQTGPLAAHHAPVERSLLRRTWPVPPASPDYSASDPAAARRVADWGPWIDTRRLYEQLQPGRSNYQLMELVRDFALSTELAALATLHCPPGRNRPHCALYDALAAGLLLVRLPEYASASLPWLLAQSAPPTAADALRQGALDFDD